MDGGREGEGEGEVCCYVIRQIEKRRGFMGRKIECCVGACCESMYFGI